MTSRWLISLLLISFLQSVITNVVDDGGDQEETNHATEDVDPPVIPVATEDVDPPVIPVATEDVDPPVIPVATDVDSSYYYRLTNAYSGSNLGLDAQDDGPTYSLKMNPIGESQGQFWRFVDSGTNVYSLRTRFLGDEYSLDIINDGTNTTPHMAKTGQYTGQRWHLIRLDDGTFKLTNEFTGNEMVLDVYNDNQVAHLSNKENDSTGQHWSFIKIGKITDY